MSRSKVKMSQDQKKKCHGIIHTASSLAAAAGAIPIPIADAIPISAAQITMVIGLGKVFDFSIGEGAAKAILNITLAISAGRFVCANLAKIIPVAGSVIGATTAGVFTEAMGWTLADDFYRMSIGEQPQNIAEAADQIKNCYAGLKR